MGDAVITAPGAQALDPKLPGSGGLDDTTVGVRPVPSQLRRLGAIEIGVLWGDLAAGVLVLAAGAILVGSPAQGGLGLALGPALVSIVVGSIVGAVLLGLVAVAAHPRGVPTMVLLRPVLGVGGSQIASVVNVVQLAGWTAFELWAMALFANRVSSEVFHVDVFRGWVVVMGVICTAMALWGPSRLINRWLKRAGLWVVIASAAYLTFHLLADHPRAAGSTTGSASIGSGIDLVIAMPVSWLPLVADYNRFSTRARTNFAGTVLGYSIGNIWFYALGALLVLGAGLTDPSPLGIAGSILAVSSSALAGLVIMVALLAGETDNAFADVYSAALSLQNLWPRLNPRWAMVALGSVGALLAATVGVGDYQQFLFLLGSLFVPLFAVVLAEWAAGALHPLAPSPRLRPGPMAAWLAGFLLYQWLVPTGPGWWVGWFGRSVPAAGRFAALGASLPAFAATFGVALPIALIAARHRPGARRRDAA